MKKSSGTLKSLKPNVKTLWKLLLMVLSGFKLGHKQILLHKKWKFSIKGFFSKCEQIHNKLRIWSHLRKKSLMENFIFCAVYWSRKVKNTCSPVPLVTWINFMWFYCTNTLSWSAPLHCRMFYQYHTRLLKFHYHLPKTLRSIFSSFSFDDDILLYVLDLLIFLGILYTKSNKILNIKQTLIKPN